MTKLSTTYASGGAEIAVVCLSFRCDAWPSDIHICEGWDDIEDATLETDEVVTFNAADFTYSRPDVESTANVSLSFALNGAVPLDDAAGSKTARQLIAIAKAERMPVGVELRVFLLSDLSAPAEIVTRFLLSGFRYVSPILSGDASFYNFKDKRFPPAVHDYNILDYPGLTHYA